LNIFNGLENIMALLIGFTPFLAKGVNQAITSVDVGAAVAEQVKINQETEKKVPVCVEEKMLEEEVAE
jgi:hypothetical protein